MPEKKVKIGPTVYDNVSEAAKAMNTSEAEILEWIRLNRNDAVFVEIGTGGGGGVDESRPGTPGEPK